MTGVGVESGSRDARMNPGLRGETLRQAQGRLWGTRTRNIPGAKAPCFLLLVVARTEVRAYLRNNDKSEVILHSAVP
ncbi:hypothetical protein GCM10011507_17390 [Edaphobacter acidisoli]|uniref:Uncharacterized protein n=1 Tax=Edaphobacter acidisoli TaxID=2040573 RepID=A0A916RR51_9BACT|nr:hypothetical protein GCM10011507_17390 [Edaphobacter acidisoli]